VSCERNEEPQAIRLGEGRRRIAGALAGEGARAMGDWAKAILGEGDPGRRRSRARAILGEGDLGRRGLSDEQSDD